jgi:hypothetical protein
MSGAMLAVAVMLYLASVVDRTITDGTRTFKRLRRRAMGARR